MKRQTNKKTSHRIKSPHLRVGAELNNFFINNVTNSVLLIAVVTAHVDHFSQRCHLAY